MDIKVLGGGCSNCDNLYGGVKDALNELGVEADIEKVQDFAKIMEYGVMRTPALVINEKVKASGKVPKVDEIKKYIQDEI